MRGGKRPGAGRKAGVPNKRTRELQAMAERAPDEGTPLEFLTSVFRDEAVDLGMRLEAAKAAAPFVHPRLAAVTLAGDPDNPITVLQRIELVPVEPDDDGAG